MNVQIGKGWKRPGMRADDYGLSKDHNHDRRNYSSIENFYGKGPKGYKRNDESIKEEVCELLFWSADVDATEMEVSVKDGCVFLDGNVPTRYAKKMAEAIVENIYGVLDIQNRLTIQS